MDNFFFRLVSAYLDKMVDKTDLGFLNLRFFQKQHIILQAFSLEEFKIVNDMLTFEHFVLKHFIDFKILCHKLKKNRILA